MTALPPTTPPPAGTQTPRTDKAQREDRRYYESGGYDFARQLERELAAAIKERDEANEACRKGSLDALHMRDGFLQQLSATRKELEEARGNASIWWNRLIELGCEVEYQGWKNARAEKAESELAALRQQLAGADEAKTALKRIAFQLDSPTAMRESALNALRSQPKGD